MKGPGFGLGGLNSAIKADPPFKLSSDLLFLFACSLVVFRVFCLFGLIFCVFVVVVVGCGCFCFFKIS